MHPSEQSGLMDPSTSKLSRSSVLHLVTSMALLLVPLILGLALTVTEKASPDKILPWSKSSVGWGAMRGELGFGLTQMALCSTGEDSSCTRLFYEDQKLVLGDDANSIAKAGNAVYVMIIMATVLSGLTFIMALAALFFRSRSWGTPKVKLLNTTMSLLAALLFLISAIVWAASCHDRLSSYSSDAHYSWGFGLSLVAAGFSGAALVIECLRANPDQYTPVL